MEMIICNDCDLEKPSSDYGKNRQKKNGLMSRCRTCAYKRSTTWRKKNKKKDKENQRAYRKRRPDKFKEFYTSYYHNPKNKEQILKLRKESYLRRRDKILKQSKKYRDKNKEKINEGQRQYRLNNLGKSSARARKYALQKQQAMLRCLSRDQIKEIESFYIKAKELSINTGIDHQVDHIIPLRGKEVCGLHVPWNLQILTAEENRKKGNGV